MHAEFGQFYVDTTTQASAQVGGASEDVAQVLIPHEAVVVLLEHFLNLALERKHSKNSLRMREKRGKS